MKQLYWALAALLGLTHCAHPYISAHVFHTEAEHDAAVRQYTPVITSAICGR